MLQEVTLVGHLAGEFAAAGLLETLSGSLVGLLLRHYSSVLFVIRADRGILGRETNGRVSVLQPTDESFSRGGEQ